MGLEILKDGKCDDHLVVGCHSLVPDFKEFRLQLKRFDSDLVLGFDSINETYTILQWTGNATNWNLIFVLGNEKGRPKLPGEWVFSHLRALAHNGMKAKDNPTLYTTNLKYEFEQAKKEVLLKATITKNEAKKDLRNELRRGFRELINLPKSDVTAGYPKINYKNNNTKNNNNKNNIITNQ